MDVDINLKLIWNYQILNLGPDPVDGSDEKFNLIQTDTTTLWESDKIEVTTNSPPASTDPTVTIR